MGLEPRAAPHVFKPPPFVFQISTLDAEASPLLLQCETPTPKFTKFGADSVGAVLQIRSFEHSLMVQITRACASIDFII